MFGEQNRTRNIQFLQFLQIIPIRKHGKHNQQKQKRAADDVFELGDRLTEKLKAETAKMQAKLGNASCVLQELGIIDQNQNLDVNKMVKSVEDGEWGQFPDKWL